MCDHSEAISRRGFAGLAALGASLALLPEKVSAQAPEPPGDTLCLMCIDHRYSPDAIGFFDSHAGAKNYDLVALAGASLAALPTDNFPYAYMGLWEQVKFAQKPPAEAGLRHPSIQNVIILDHMNCGAYKAQFPEIRTPDDERLKHQEIANKVGPMFAARGLKTNIFLLDVYANPKKTEWIWPLEKKR